MKITLDEEAVMKIITDLEFLITSLDRIGSANLSEGSRAAELSDFIDKGSVFRRISTMRRLIWERIDSTISHAEVLALEEKIEAVSEKWKVKRS